MKRIFSLIMVIALLLSSATISNAEITEKLQGHWADNIISRGFLATYFPYLAKDNFMQFDPQGTLTELDFTTSLASLFADYNYETSSADSNKVLSREDMAYLLGNKLLEIGVEIDTEIELPFKDIDTMSNESKESLKLLFDNKIIIGDSNSNFDPNRELTHVEAIIVLQRVKEVLESMNEIAFEALGIVQSYNNQEELIVKEENDKVLLTITKQFPTPGYTMTVDKIMREGKNYKIYFNIVEPRPDMILPQVITYKTLTIEIDKNLLNEPPYNFILDGYNSVIVR
ncbi:MAG: S-layer homology domain-containing protein [Tissierellia bacterium]|nr:S-layer homology domain-containing protein [Tissierellia bacterium]MDD4726193.1 S-layer homology domain-containing protein [Tissierellia bacterium]